MSNKIARRLILIASIGAFCAIGACGVTGKLDTAPPMWGKAKKDYEEKRANDAQLEKQKGETETQNKSN